MSTAVNVSKFEVKSHDEPDEVRTPSKTRIEVVRLGGFTLGRFRLDEAAARQLRDLLRPTRA